MESYTDFGLYLPWASLSSTQEAFFERRLSDWPSGCPPQISTRLEPLAAPLIIWLDSTSTWRGQALS